MVDEKTRKRWKKEDTLKKEESVRLHSQSSINDDFGLSTKSEPTVVVTDPGFYGATPPSPSYSSKPDVDMKFKGWVAMFGDHFLCELGCKRFADKSLDKVLRFIEKEIRHFYEPRQIKKKGKSGVEVKSYVRKERKKKEALIPDEDIDKAFDPATDNE